MPANGWRREPPVAGRAHLGDLLGQPVPRRGPNLRHPAQRAGPHLGQGERVGGYGHLHGMGTRPAARPVVEEGVEAATGLQVGVDVRGTFWARSVMRRSV